MFVKSVSRCSVAQPQYYGLRGCRKGYFVTVWIGKERNRSGSVPKLLLIENLREGLDQGLKVLPE